MKHIKLGAMLLCLMVWLPGCSTTKPPQVIRVPFETIKIEKQVVPDGLLEPCQPPELEPLETTGDLERLANEALAAARCGNEDKAKIREWQSQ